MTKFRQLIGRIYTPSRYVIIEPNGIRVVFRGLSSVAALYQHGLFKYENIVSVTAGPIDGISPFAPRIGYSNPITGARAGRFRTKGHHMLVSFSDPDVDCLTIHLRTKADTISEFDMIQVQIDNPHERASQILQKIK